jgi:ABC-type transporter Mla subunit MlaD
MRRIVVIATLLAAAGVWWTGPVAADDSHTYKVEMYNAFGIVEGSDVRIAGVNAGTVTGLGITPDKRAVLTIETSGPVGELGRGTRCSSEPQSLIAEYFLTCTPKGPPLPDGGAIPASHVKQTVQSDLVQNTLREPFKDRLQLLINEFGTALAGNPQALNEAIRLGAPALTKLEGALHILASERRTIRDLNVDSDKIITRLADRRADVVRFIQEARDTAAISISQRDELSTDFDRLDDFLHELRPTLAALGGLARQQTPLLSDLRLAAPGLNQLALELPDFNAAAERSLRTLGDAAVTGRQALKQGRDEIQALAASGRNAFETADALDKFLLDADSPKRVVEIDARAARSCRNETRPCYSTGRAAPTGYTGLESLLNYVYYQAGALNQFDRWGHLLHFSLFDVGVSPCASYNAGGQGSDFGVPNADNSGTTTQIADANHCVAWLGASQPGINEDPGAPPYESAYDPSVCPNGSEDKSLCDPGASATSSASRAKGGGRRSGRGARQGRGAGAAPGEGRAPAPGLPPSPLPETPKHLPQRLRDLLGIGDHRGLLPRIGGGKRGSDGGGAGRAANDLLDLLFSP